MMKRKNVLALVFILVFGVSTLSGCNQFYDFDKVNDSIPVNDVREFRYWLSETINLEYYDEVEMDTTEGQEYARYKCKYSSDNALGGSITFEDGTEVHTPVTRKELEEIGWHYYGIDGDYVEYRNDQDQSIFLCWGQWETEESTAEEEVYHRIDIMRKSPTNREVTPPKYSFGVLPWRVTNAASIQEVISDEVRKPMEIVYDGRESSEEGAVITLSYHKFYEGDYHFWSIDFSVKENKIIRISLS